ncbi:MAG: aminodeoxychorismate synthase component I [Rhodothalassiaceae bacterium]
MPQLELRRPPVLLFDDALAPPDEPASRLFGDPEDVLLARSIDEVRPVLEAADVALARGRHIAGMIAFEAVAAFEPGLRKAMRHRLAPEPLLWLGVFAAPRLLTRGDVARLLTEAEGGSRRDGRLAHLADDETERDYGRAFARIRDLIAAGDVYQVNHVFARRYRLMGDALALYRRLRQAQPVAHGAYVDTGAMHVLSLSPELFVRVRKGRLEARPMKGTAPRGPDLEADEAAARTLAADAKSQAENLMIVDLLRNDLARVSVPGSVAVPRLFAVERYPSLLQMTSQIVAERRKDLRFSDLLAALFPCGSVTGAPKLRAIERILETEAEPRGLYTGAIGWAAPDGDLAFNVAIRTLIEEKPGLYRYGIGSGLVADSEERAEYRECLMKAEFLAAEADRDFALLETMRAEGGAVRDLGLHLERMAAAARYFGFAFDPEAAGAAALAAVRGHRGPQMLRLLSGRDGDLTATVAPLVPWPSPVRLLLAEQALAGDSPLLRHKTTRRAHYEAPLSRARARGYDEVLFLNAAGRLTEGARTSLFVRREGRLLTPPVSEGLLPGVLRRRLLESGRAIEAPLSVGDLLDAEAVYVGNALRGLMPARLETP